MTQADLFGPEALPAPSPEVVTLARGIPPAIRFGTSTWTYDGWFGDVYHRRYRGPQPASRLEEYARYPLFRTVGIDSAFYDPPSEEELRSYGQALPRGFPCVSKVWDRITARRLGQEAPQPGLAGMRNPEFLSAALFKESVLGPYARVFRDHAGCFVFEFQAMRGKDLPDPLQWADQLDDFLGDLPRDFRYAVELRNPELLRPVHGEVLRRTALHTCSTPGPRCRRSANSWTSAGRFRRSSRSLARCSSLDAAIPMRSSSSNRTTACRSHSRICGRIWCGW